MKTNENQAPNTEETLGNSKRAIRLGYIGPLILFLAVCLHTNASHGALDCDSLLAAAMGGSPVSDSDAPLSGSARQFLAVVDVGLSNLGPEVPGLLKNLRLLVTSDHPVNPFLNFRGPLGMALAGKVETLIPNLNSEWVQIQEVIASRMRSAEDQAAQKEQDTEATKDVYELRNIPFDFVGTNINPSELGSTSYLGQTSEYYLFESSAPSQKASAIFRLSKRDQSFVKISVIPFITDRGHRDRWFYNGQIYGFGKPEVAGAAVSQSEVRVFRLDPKTGKIDWAEPMEVAEGAHNIYHWIRIPNVAVGVRLQTAELGRGDIFRFDYDLFRFVPTGLNFDVTTLGLPGEQRLLSIADAEVMPERNGSYLKIGKFLKTDGRILAQAGNSVEWQIWSISDFAIPEHRQHRLSVTTVYELVIREAIPEYGPFNQWGKNTSVTAMPPIRYTYETSQLNADGRNLFEPIHRGASILFVPLRSQSAPRFMVIDRGTWTASEAEIVGGPQNIKSQWRVIRNQKNEILLRFDSTDKMEVALWKLDETSLKFELQFHELYQGRPLSSLQEGHVDYEDKSFVGWVTWNRIIVRMKTHLSRD